MSQIPNGVCLAWPGAVVAIPAGWQRVAALDGLHVRGAAVPGGVGGAATHLHGIGQHNHGRDLHTHTVTLGNHVNNPGPLGTKCEFHGSAGISPTIPIADCTDHIHTMTIFSMGGGLNNAQPAFNTPAANNDPLRLDVIWITPTVGADVVPAGVLGYWPKSALPSGAWAQYAAANARLLRGAAAGTDGGATGGAANHSHSSLHNHTQDAHWHYFNASSYTALPTYPMKQSTHWDPVGASHRHYGPYFLDSKVIIINQAADAALATATSFPSNRCLGVIENISGGNVPPPVGLVAVTLGPAAPAGWVPCDGVNSTFDMTNLFALAVPNLANVGTTAGADSHSHAADSHNHLQNSHTHSGLYTLTGKPGNQVTHSGLPQRNNEAGHHRHPLTVTATTGTNQSATVDVTAAVGLPQYKDVLFIEYMGAEQVAAPDVYPTGVPILVGGSDLTIRDTDFSGPGTDYSPDDSALGVMSNARVAVARHKGTLVAAVIPAGAGACYVGNLDRDEFSAEGMAVIAGTWLSVAMEVIWGESSIVLMLLEAHAGPVYRWHQAFGTWDPVAGEYTFGVPVECDTAPPGSFPNASGSSNGALRRMSDGGLAFAFIDDANDLRIMRCRKVPDDATGTWEEV